jgi:RIO kinase 1
LVNPEIEILLFRRKTLRKFDDDFDFDYEDDSPKYPELETFFDEGYLSQVLYTVKSGKEATVYCCQAGPALDTTDDLVAAKIYRPRQNRTFKNDAVYQEGRMRQEKRERRAMQSKTEFGREVQAGMWVGHEFATMKALHKAGASIPRPLVSANSALLMEYLGDAQQAAPLLNQADFELEEAHSLFKRIMENIRLWLSLNYVHGDLSAYNILYWQGTLKIIDFPQAVDPRFNSNALTLLTRDIENISRFFSRLGVASDPQRIVENLWNRFRHSHL